MAKLAKAKEAIVKEEKDLVLELVKVELKNANEGVHTVFCKSGVVNFINGVAEVNKELVAELTETGLIK